MSISKPHRRRIYHSLWLATATVLFVGQSGFGFVLILVCLPLFVWLSCSAYIILCIAEQRAQQMIRALIWLLAVALIVGVHHLRDVSTRHQADEVVFLIKRYAQTHGRYPATLDALGIRRLQLQERLGRAGYFYHEMEMPYFYYKSSFSAFDTYVYDFKKSVWIFRPD